VSRPRPWGQCMSKEGLPSARAVVPPPRLRTSSLTFDAMDAIATSLAKLGAEGNFYEVVCDAD